MKGQGKDREQAVAQGDEVASPESRREASVLVQESPNPHPAGLGLVNLKAPQICPGPRST